ncbi:OmpH family outer membrane protein [Candidatus Babeliales bacterium]|nr:OmpH family outer membrane protein [Candidatus Babeliales bacterium]
MKKLFLAVLSLLIVFSNLVVAKDFYVDRNKILAESKEGQIFLKKQERKRVEAEEEVKKLEQEAHSLSQRIQGQVSMLSREAFFNKQRKLGKLIKDFERKQQDAKEELKVDFQLGFEKIKTNQYDAIKAVYQSKSERTALKDKNAPDVLEVDPSVDITNEALVKVDAAFQRSTLLNNKVEKKA